MFTWIKGEPLPKELVDEILKAIGLNRETQEEFWRRSTASTAAGNSERHRQAYSDNEDGDDEDGDDEVCAIATRPQTLR